MRGILRISLEEAMALKGHRLDLYIGSGKERHRGKVADRSKWMLSRFKIGDGVWILD